MKKGTLILFLCVLSCLAHAQSPMVVSFGDTSKSFAGQRGVITADESYVINGKLFSHPQSTFNDLPHIAKFDKNHVMQWSLCLDEGSGTASQVVVTPEQDILAVWSKGTQSVVAKIDANGNVLWLNRYTNIFSMEGIYADPNGDIYCTGDRFAELVVLKLNSNGNLIWCKSLNALSQYHFGRGIVESADGNLLVLGGASFNTSATKNRISLSKIDKQGNLIWGNVYLDPTKPMLCTGFALSSNKDKVLISAYSGHPTSGTENLLSILVDTSGQYINNKELSYQFVDRYNSVTALPNGEFALAGYTKPVQVCGGNAIFVKMDANNDTLLTKVYGASSGQGAIFTDIKHHPTVGITAFGLGSIFGYWNGGSEHVCLHLDQQLNVPCYLYHQNMQQSQLNITTSDTTTIAPFTPIVTHNYQTIQDVIQAADVCTGQPLAIRDQVPTLQADIYPNPASDQFVISCPSEKNYAIRIYDMMGREVFSSSDNNAQAIISTRNFVSGTFLLKVSSHSGQFTSKFVVQH